MDILSNLLELVKEHGLALVLAGVFGLLLLWIGKELWKERKEYSTQKFNEIHTSLSKISEKIAEIQVSETEARKNISNISASIALVKAELTTEIRKAQSREAKFKEKMILDLTTMRQSPAELGIYTGNRPRKLSIKGMPTQ